MARSGRVPNFDAEVVRVVREASETVVEAGKARLEEGEGAGGAFVRLVPTNPNACETTVFLDYPTLATGPEGHTTEMFGTERERLEELPLLIEAVIAGPYEWERRQARFLCLVRYTQLRGTFHTADGPWRFTRAGGEPARLVERRTYEPY